jgi:SAM-dependent methyltransferase
MSASPRASTELSPADRDWLLGFSGAFRDRAEAERYLYDFWGRARVIMEWLAHLHGQGARALLELGSAPFLLTLLLRRHFDFDLRLANYFGDPSRKGPQTFVLEGPAERQEFAFDHFNVEVDAFPYAEGSFDAVVFSEILEHLLLSADRTLAEIHRVLRPCGHVLVSTPNVARLGNAIRLLKGLNINDGYSPYGVYGRHNREYTMPEVVDALERNGFEIAERRVQNIYPHPLRTRLLQSLRPRVWYEHLFVLGRKRG